MNLLKKKNKDTSNVVKRDNTHDMTLFILGCAESGKTTLWRNLQLVGDDSVGEDKKYFQKIIYGNTINSINRLLEVAEKHDFKITDDNKERQERLKETSASMGEFKLPRFPLRLVFDLKCLWEDEAIQKAHQITLDNPEYHIPGRLQYYMNNIFRILSPDFRPDNADILSIYDPSDTCRTSEIFYRKVRISAFCFPAGVSEDKKWEVLGEIPPDVIIYTINLNDYDQFYANNKTQNKLLHSINVLSDLLTTKSFKTCHSATVFLNCVDLFKDKAAKKDLKCCFPDYSDGLEPEKALAYVHKFLTEKVSGKEKPVVVKLATAIETLPFEEIVDTVLPLLPPASRSPLSQLVHLNGHHNGADKHDDNKSDRGSEKGDSNNNNVKPDKKKKGKKLLSLESGFESVQGRRKQMEDKHVIMDNFRKDFPNAVTTSDDEQCFYYGVYDGHGGVDTSKLVEEMLHKNILTDPSFAAGDIEQAIKNGFLVTDTHILTQPSKSGSTAVIAVAVGNNLITANAGDSECVMCKQIGTGKKSKTEHVVMSYKHVPTDESEKQRISAAGGLVVFGRLFGSLAVSRSLGDRDYKDGGQHFVSAEPFIKQVELSPEDQFLVMACDGLWDKLSYEDVVGTVLRLRKEGKGATEICKVLVQDAINKESLDNITVVLVFFNWKK